MAISGSVNKILKHSFVDGPGNRAVIFLQGCNLRCLYYHNPYKQTLCSHCGVCVSFCPFGALRFQDKQVVWDDALCQECDACIHACPQNSSPHVRELTADQIWQFIAPVEPYFSGVTASGGEPAQQIEFLIDFFTFIKHKTLLTTLIETNGCIEEERLKPLLPVLDIAKGAMKQGVRILSIGSANSEFMRVTGYRIRRVDLENAKREVKNRHSSASLGAGFLETKPNNLRRRERKVRFSFTDFFCLLIKTSYP